MAFRQPLLVDPLRGDPTAIFFIEHALTAELPGHEHDLQFTLQRCSERVRIDLFRISGASIVPVHSLELEICHPEEWRQHIDPVVAEFFRVLTSESSLSPTLM